MLEADPHWSSVPLGNPPRIEHLARGAHGQRGVESYELGATWSLHLYEYAAELHIDSVSVQLAPRWVTLCPPGSLLQYNMTGPGTNRYVLFTLTEGAEPLIPMPLARGIGDYAGEVGDRLDQVIGVFAQQPRQAEAALWDLLWRLTELPSVVGSPDQTVHRALQQALRIIELQLADLTPVPKLAAAVSVSPTHLTRLFRRTFNTTVVGYIRARRMERAAYLLTHSTQSIKAIAAEVGIPDLHGFNKTVREVLGTSPTEYRRRHSA